MATISFLLMLIQVSDIITPRGLVESCSNIIDHSFELVSVSVIRNNLSQELLVSKILKQIIRGILEIVSVIEELAFSTLQSIEFSHLGFQRFFIRDALIVRSFSHLMFVFVDISTSPFISTVSSGIVIVLSSPSLFLPL